MANLHKKLDKGLDVLLHLKESETSENILFPITTYENVIGSPGIAKDVSQLGGGPYYFYGSTTTEIDQELLGKIIEIG